MFLQPCVKNSVHTQGVVYPSMQWWSVYTSPHPSPEMATEVGGTHPTGMYSCKICFYTGNLPNEENLELKKMSL